MSLLKVNNYYQRAKKTVTKIMYTPVTTDGILFERKSSLPELKQIYGERRVEAWCDLTKHIYETEIKRGNSIYPDLSLDTGKNGTLLDFIFWIYQNGLRTGHSCQGAVNKQTHTLDWDDKNFSVKANTHNDYDKPYRSLPYITFPLTGFSSDKSNMFNQLEQTIEKLTTENNYYKFEKKKIGEFPYQETQLPYRETPFPYQEEHFALYAKCLNQGYLEELLLQVMNTLNSNSGSGFKPINYNYKWPSLQT